MGGGGGILRLRAAAIFFMIFLGGATAVTLCNVTDEGFAACKPSITQPDPVAPSAECCDAVSEADLKCLCSYKNSFMLPSLGIDPDLALALPAKCNVPSPPDC